MPIPLDYRQPSSPAVRIGRVTVAIVLGRAVAQLLSAQLDPLAPLRQGFGPDAPAARQAAGRAAITAPVVQLSDGRNLELHFDDTAHSPAAGVLAGGLYYALNYALYPARAFVGDDRRPINGDVTLRAADRVPPERWLRDHGVAAVVTYPLDAAGLHRPIARAVRPTP